MHTSARIFVAGHNGMVGSAIVRKLQAEGFQHLILRSSAELDLRNQAATMSFFEKERPEYVFLAVAKVGGILANNTYRADFLYDNMMIEANIIHAAYQYKVTKLLFLGSSCIYPKMAPQPLQEASLLTGLLEYTNEPYAIAKIAGIKLCESYRLQYGCNFISAMPTNLYGPNDNYDLEKSHVLPAMIRKFHEAKVNGSNEVVIWGSGTPMREFMYVDDLADACYFLMKEYDGMEFVNVGTGKEISIHELALLIKSVVQCNAEIHLDSTKPDGTPRKLMDVGKLKGLGWTSKIELKEGIELAYQDFILKASV